VVGYLVKSIRMSVLPSESVTLVSLGVIGYLKGSEQISLEKALESSLLCLILRAITSPGKRSTRLVLPKRNLIENVFF
jgi:hypothetical protein